MRWCGFLTDLARWRPRRVTARGAIGVLSIAAVVAGVVAGLAGLRTDTGPSSFLPASDATLAALDRSARAFGGDPVVVLAESPDPGGLLSQENLPTLLALEGQLARLPDVAVAYGPATALNQLAGSSQNMLAQVSGRRDALRQRGEQEASRRGAGQEETRAAGDRSVADFDIRYGSLLVRALPAGLPTLRNERFVRTVMFDEGGQPRPQWRFVLPSPDSAALLVRPRQDLDQAGTERLTEAVRAAVDASGLPLERVTVSGSPAVAAALAEQVRHEGPLLGLLAVVLVGLTYWLTPWRARRRDRLIPPAVTLSATALVVAALGWLGLPLSVGLIGFLPILIGIGSDFPAYLLRGADVRTVVVTALASASAFAALAISPLPFVRDLGLALAAGVVVTVGLGLVVRRLRPPESATPEATAEEITPAGAGESARPERRRRLVGLVVTVAIAAGGWVGLPSLDVEARPEQLAAGLPAVTDARYVEQQIGASGEVRIVLRGDDVLTPEALDWLRRAQDEVVVGLGDDLRVLVSLPDLLRFVGDDPTPQQIGAAAQFLPDYLTGAVLSADGQEAAVSLGLRFGDISEQVRLLDSVRAGLPPTPPGYTAELVGLPVAAARGYELVAADRVLTNALGIAVAGAVLTVGLRRRRHALLAVLAAVLATGWGLAAAWALGVALSPLTVALGSLTTATACEFTILLIGAARRARLRLTVAAAACAAAAGYLALAVSGLAVIREFGLLLAASVGLSYLAARVVVGAATPPSEHTPARTGDDARIEVKA